MRMSKFIVALNALSLTIAMTAAEAHHPGGPGNTGSAGPIVAMSASTLAQGTAAAGIVVDTMNLERLSDATLKNAADEAHEAGAGHAHVHSLDTLTSASLFFAYGVTRDITVSVRLPYLRRSGIREAHEKHGDEHTSEHGGEDDHAGFEVHNDGDTRGIGDLTALAQWKLVDDQPRGFQGAVIAGFKAPTGKTRESSNDGALLDAEFQPGSGSWDVLFGLALTRRTGPLSFDVSALYTLVTEGVQQTDLGDRLTYGVAVSYRLLGEATMNGNTARRSHAHRDAHPDGDGHAHAERAASLDSGLDAGFNVDAILEVGGEWQNEHEAAGVGDPNSGGHVMFVSPGVRISKENWSGFLSLGIPVVNNLNGIQSEPEWRLTAGTGMAF